MEVTDTVCYFIKSAYLSSNEIALGTETKPFSYRYQCVALFISHLHILKSTNHLILFLLLRFLASGWPDFLLLFTSSLSFSSSFVTSPFSCSKRKCLVSLVYVELLASGFVTEKRIRSTRDHRLEDMDGPKLTLRNSQPQANM